MLNSGIIIVLPPEKRPVRVTLWGKTVIRPASRDESTEPLRKRAMTLLLIALLVLTLGLILMRNFRRSSMVERATFSNSTLEVNVTKLVRRHLLSTSMLSIVDIVPKDLIEVDDQPRLEILLKQGRGSKVLLKLTERESFDVARGMADGGQEEHISDAKD